MKYCMQCVSQTRCKTCVLRYTLTSMTPLCGKCMSNCWYCINQSSCVVCNGGYYYTGGKCKLCQGCVNCVGSATNCISCNMNGYVIQYDEEQGIWSCGLCEQVIPFCITCQNSTDSINSTDLICLACVTGMYPTLSVCKLCPQGCLTCTSPSVCLTCRPEYYY